MGITKRLEVEECGGQRSLLVRSSSLDVYFVASVCCGGSLQLKKGSKAEGTHACVLVPLTLGAWRASSWLF